MWGLGLHIYKTGTTSEARDVKVQHNTKAYGWLRGHGDSCGGPHQEPGTSISWAAMLFARPGSRSSPSGRKAEECMAPPQGASEASKWLLKTCRWQDKSQMHSWDCKPACVHPRTPGLGLPCLQTIILKAGFPGDTFTLSLRKAKRKEPLIVPVFLWLTLKIPESRESARWEGDLCLSQPHPQPGQLRWGYLF